MEFLLFESWFIEKIVTLNFLERYLKGFSVRNVQETLSWNLSKAKKVKERDEEWKTNRNFLNSTKNLINYRNALDQKFQPYSLGWFLGWNNHKEERNN